MKEFIQIRKDGMIESQGTKFYSGELFDNACFYTRSAYNVDYLYDYFSNRFCISDLYAVCIFQRYHSGSQHRNADCILVNSYRLGL